MATAVRTPLAPRLPHQLQPISSPLNDRKPPLGPPLKRPRSPEHHSTHATHDAMKRHKVSALQGKDNQEQKAKEKRRALREAMNEDFRIKYTKAFPAWTFYFDATVEDGRASLIARILALKARVTEFFSNEVTHFITNHPIPESEGEANKENCAKPRASGSTNLRSPIKLKGLNVDEVSTSGYDLLLRKAKQFNTKIWDSSKLSSVLDRCSVPGTPTQNVTRSLTSLLESERRNGTTTERDPSQRRHDYRYFSKGSYFVLIEDARGELATIAALEYPATKSGDGKEKANWPILYCDPRARGPFVEYNEKQEKRREKLERQEKEQEEKRMAEIKAKKLRLKQKKGPDLRRSVSMNNLHREANKALDAVEGEDFDDPLNIGNIASGYFDSTAGNYIAASGNSVGLTSTNGTTSTVGGSSTRLVTAYPGLPPALRGRLQREVITSRRVSSLGADRLGNTSKPGSSTAMLPPEVPVLKKSKSLNTFRPPRRDEKSKPGYCESCHQKFSDFDTHVSGRRHQKFASNDTNFIQLDYILNRVKEPVDSRFAVRSPLQDDPIHTNDTHMQVDRSRNSK